MKFSSTEKPRVSFDELVSDSRLYFSKEDFLDYVSKVSFGRVINFYKDIELNVLGISYLKGAEQVSVALKIMILWHEEKMLAGIPITQILDLERHRLELQLKYLNGELARGVERGRGNFARYVADVKFGILWLDRNRPLFTSRPIHGQILKRSLVWNASLRSQERVVREALASIGVDGCYAVNDKTFLNRGLAMAHLKELSRNGRPGTLTEGWAASGEKAYGFLHSIHGNALPDLFCRYGVYAICYGSWYTCFISK